MKFDEGFLARMREATKLLHSDGPLAATEAIRQALQHGATDLPGSVSRPDLDTGSQYGGSPSRPDPASRTQHNSDTGKAAQRVAGMRNKWANAFAPADIEDVDVVDAPNTGKPGAKTGRFISASCTSPDGARRYKLYIPSGYKNEPLPLVVMLHGCTQNPDDFAAGTEMNKLAEEHNWFVAYPEQDKSSNATLCWNWFQPAHQQQGRGEPAILAQITREITLSYAIDAKRIYIAGLSAGGAMAVIMAATYPDIYAAVGVHSGLPYGVARDMPSAFAAMKRGRAKATALKAQTRAPSPLAKVVPAIVFHGDRDATVHPENAELVLAQCAGSSTDQSGMTASIEESATAKARSYTRTVLRDKAGNPIAEKWIVHGAAHAWAGGSPNGSYTDSEGPSAAREMLRFFKEHPQP